MNAEPAEDGGEVIAHGSEADVQLGGDGRDTVSAPETAEDLPLSGAQFGELWELASRWKRLEAVEYAGSADLQGGGSLSA